MRNLFIFALAVALALCSLFTLSGCKKSVEVYTKYEITAEYVPENNTLTGVMKVTFNNTTDNEITQLKFNLYPNAYRENALYQPISKGYEKSAYYAGESYGEIVISSVNGSKNWEVCGEDENVLCVNLERALYHGDKVVLDVGFTTKLANVNHRTGVTKKTVNLCNFYPILCAFKNGGFYECAYYAEGDPFYSDCADYKMTLTLPKDYAVASTGSVVAEKMLESKKEYTMSATNVRDFALVLSKNYRVEQRIEGDVTLFYYYYKDEAPQKTMDVALESLRYFERNFGEYPYSTYTVAETGFCYGGMEYPALSLISDTLTGEDRARVTAHETAHQWWAITVGSDQIENAWQDEGLAEYSTLLFFENYEKYGFTREWLVAQALREYRSYYDVYGSVLGRADTSMVKHLKDYFSAYEYRCLAYDKAVVMFDTLRKSVGDKKFMSALKRYYSANAFQIATKEALVGSFEKTGLDVVGFFDSFLEGKAIL